MIGDDGKSSDFPIWNGGKLFLQLYKELLEMLSPIFAVTFLAVTTNVSTQAVNTLKAALVTAWTLQNNLTIKLIEE